MEGCFDRHFSRINGFRLKGWVDGWMDASQKCMDGYMDDGWMDRWMERTTMFIEMNSCFLMDGWMDGWKALIISLKIRFWVCCIHSSRVCCIHSSHEYVAFTPHIYTVHFSLNTVRKKSIFQHLHSALLANEKNVFLRMRCVFGCLSLAHTAHA